MRKFFVYTDGASRGNPGKSAIAFLIFDHSKKIIFKYKKFLGIATNNEAEYQAVLLALKKLLDLKIKKAIFFLDSLLVVKQLNNKFKVKDERMQRFYLEIKKIIFQNGIDAKFQYIKREENKQADKLVNEVLDKQKK